MHANAKNNIFKTTFVNRLAQTASDALHENLRSDLAQRVANLLDNVSESSAICNMCCELSHEASKCDSFNDIQEEYRSVAESVIKYLNHDISRRCARQLSHQLLEDMTRPNWELLHHDMDYVINTNRNTLADDFCWELVYFSDRWSYVRLMRSAYSFAKVLLKESVTATGKPCRKE